MIFRFNKGQLGRNLDARLNRLLSELQKGTNVEIEVWPLEFPEKFSVKIGNDVAVIAWDAKDSEYKILPSPEPIPESQKDTVDLPQPEPEHLGVGAAMEAPGPGATPESERVKSEIGQRVDALAGARIRLAVPFDSEQRLEIWNAFCNIVLKELWK